VTKISWIKQITLPRLFKMKARLSHTLLHYSAIMWYVYVPDLGLIIAEPNRIPKPTATTKMPKMHAMRRQ